MYKLEAITVYGAYVSYKCAYAKDVINKFDSIYYRRGYRISLFKLKSYGDYEEYVFVRFIKRGFR